MREFSRLEQLCSELNDMAEGHSSERVSIMVETSEDEAVLVGTAPAFLRLAAEILTAVSQCSSGRGESIDFGGVTLACASIGESLNHDAHVVARSVCLANSADDCSAALLTFE